MNEPLRHPLGLRGG